MSGHEPGRSTASRAGLADLQQLRDHLLRSILDLDLEHAAGDIDDADYAALRSGYVSEAAATLRAIGEAAGDEAAGPAAPEQPAGRRAVPERPAAYPARPPRLDRLGALRRLLGRRSSRRVLVAIGVACMVGLVTLAAARAAGLRLPGESESGSIALASAAEVRQELDQAQILAGEGMVASAVAVYDKVLAESPHQAEALADMGWLVRIVGLREHSRALVSYADGLLAEAVAAAPGYARARAFYGIALLEDGGRLGQALGQFRAFLADRPSRTLLDSVGARVAQAFVAAHRGVPAALASFAR